MNKEDLKMDIKVNGLSINAQVKSLNKDTTVSQAQTLLKNRHDGYDTIAARLSTGEDVLILTRSSQKFQNFDQLQVDGQKAQILFTENEKNTNAECNTVGGVMSGLGAGAALGFVGLILASGMGDRFAVSGKMLGAVVGGGAVAMATVGLLGETAPARKAPNDTLTNSISQVK